MKPTPPPPTADELRELSHHITYEWDMLVELVRILASPPDGHDRVTRNACVESFLIHARQVLLFLHDEIGVRRREKDCFAVDYAPTWAVARPQCSKELHALKDSVDKRVAHLTTVRVEPTTYTIQKWADELVTLIEKFLALAPNDLFVARPSVPLSARLIAARTNVLPNVTGVITTTGLAATSGPIEHVSSVASHLRRI